MHLPPQIVTRKADLQIWVCVNSRSENDLLPCCGLQRGEEMVAALRKATAKLPIEIWINRTLCQGFCHREGVTITLEPLGLKFQAVTLAQVASIVQTIQNSIVQKA